MTNDLLNNSMQDVITNADLCAQLVQQTVSEYTSTLDDAMKDVYKEIINIDYPGLDILEKHFLKLSSIIYFVIENVEKLGIYDDMGKASAKESYNNIYLKGATEFGGNKKPTAGELSAAAENGTIYENAASAIYTRSYKIVKAKVEAAQAMVATISKIISKRMQEEQFTANTEFKQEKKILNEEFH